MTSNSDDQTTHPTYPTGINPPPPFYTEHPKKINKMTRFKFFPKRKQSVAHKTNNDTSLLNTPTVQHPRLPRLSSVITNAYDYPMGNDSNN